MTVTLINRTKRMKVFNLPHDVYCDALGRCACGTLPGPKLRRVPRSLTLPAGVRVEDLDDAVIKTPELSAAINAGAVDVIAADQKAKKKTKPKQGADPTSRGES